MNRETTMTWAALLGKWTEFAQASASFPKTKEGERWRAAVAPIISLQATTFALADLDSLAGDDSRQERALGIDRSEILIRQGAATLHELWKGEPLPQELSALINDARTVLARAKDSGVEWTVTEESLVADHPAQLIEALAARGFEGDLYLPVPGSILFRTSPAAFARGPFGERPEEYVLRAVKEFLIDVSRPERVPGMRQVYRQFDFGTGRVRRDYVVAFSAELPPGQAQLIPVIERGVPSRVHLPIPGMANLEPVPVEFASQREESER